MTYATLYFLAAIAHAQVGRTIYALWHSGEYRLALVGAIVWLCIIRIAE